jgi:transcriptional regulator of aromatic amino acid metabolism
MEVPQVSIDHLPFNAVSNLRRSVTEINPVPLVMRSLLLPCDKHRKSLQDLLAELSKNEPMVKTRK